MGEQENMDEIDKEEIDKEEFITGVGDDFPQGVGSSGISPLLLYKLGLVGGFGSDEPADGICKKCGSEMKRVVYGFPSRMPDEDDDYVLGGCVIMPGAPQFSCPKCAKD
jgi:hypothetical protein